MHEEALYKCPVIIIIIGSDYRLLTLKGKGVPSLRTRIGGRELITGLSHQPAVGMHRARPTVR